MAHDTDVLIVGGGLNGPCLALALAQVGINSIIIDASKAPGDQPTQDVFNGRAYALSLASTYMLAALGLWRDLAQHAQPITDIKVSDGYADGGTGPFILHFNHAELEEGPMGYMVEDRHLRRVLHTALKTTPQIHVIQGQHVIAQDTTNAAAHTVLQDGRTLSARLLVGADGVRGETAPRAGIKRMVRDYRQTALVCAIAHEKPHNAIAHQVFFPSGPLAILPLQGDVCSIVWTETQTRAADIAQLEDDAFIEVLRPRFGDFLGSIALQGTRAAYPLRLTLAQQFVQPHLALVGDAAHGVHPIAGQGLNHGFRDVGALAETLANAKRRGEDIAAPDVLARYQRWRRFDTATLALTTDGVNTLFSNTNGVLRAMRGLGLGMLNATPHFKRGLMRQAAGLSGDVPKLLQGQSL